MANTKVYVNTDSSGGTDGSTNASGVAFPTLPAALTYVAANKSAGDIWTIICSAPSGVMPSGTTIDFTGVTTNSTGYLHVRPNRGNEGGTVADQRHGGVWSTSKFRLSYNNTFSVNVQYVRVIGLQLFPTGVSTTPPSGPFMSADNCKLERCLIYADPAYAGDGSAGNNIGIRGSGGTSNTVVCNNIVIGFALSTAYTPGVGITVASGKQLNNTVINCRRGLAWSGVSTTRGNLGYGSTLEDFVTGGWNYNTLTTHNGSEDATAPGTSNQTSRTFTFNDAGGLDYRLASGDSGAAGLGVDLSADDWTDVDSAQNGPSLDIADVVRSSWSIGASEPVSAGGGAYKLIGKLGGKLVGKV